MFGGKGRHAGRQVQKPERIEPVGNHRVHRAARELRKLGRPPFRDRHRPYRRVSPGKKRPWPKERRRGDSFNIILDIAAATFRLAEKVIIGIRGCQIMHPVHQPSGRQCLRQPPPIPAPPPPSAGRRMSSWEQSLRERGGPCSLLPVSTVTSCPASAKRRACCSRISSTPAIAGT